MLHQDYLMRMFLQLAQGIVETLSKEKKTGQDFEASAELLEASLSDATEVDGSLLLRLDPQSMVSILQLSQSDPTLMEYVGRTLLLESDYLEKAGNVAVASLRKEQANALAEAYGFPLSEEDLYPEALDEFFESTQKGL